MGGIVLIAIFKLEVDRDEKIKFLNPAQPFLLAGWITSIIYVNIIYTLTVSFGDIGKAVRVVLLVMQVAGTGGTFPIEMTPIVLPKGKSTPSIHTQHGGYARMYSRLLSKHLLAGTLKIQS